MMHLINVCVDPGIKDQGDQQRFDIGFWYVKLCRDKRNADPRVRLNELHKNLSPAIERWNVRIC